jgi:hypothetical protein
MIDYAAILSRKYFGQEWTLDGDDYDGLNWNGEIEKPTKQVLDALWPEVQNEIAEEKASKDATKQAVLKKLGITENELRAIIG